MSSGCSSGNPGRQRRARVAVEHRRVDDPRADRVDPDAELRELRRDPADEADDEVLRGRVDRIQRHRRQPGERCGHDDRAAGLHHPREPAHAEDDAVDVRRPDAPVLLVRQPRTSLAGHDAGVQARELDRRTASQAAGSETSNPSARSSTCTSTPSASSRSTIARPIPDAPPVTSADSGNKHDLADVLALLDQPVRVGRALERERRADERPDRALRARARAARRAPRPRRRAGAASGGRGRSPARRRCARRGAPGSRPPTHPPRSRSRRPSRAVQDGELAAKTGPPTGSRTTSARTCSSKSS